MKFLDRWDEKWLEPMLDSRKRAKRIKQLGEVRPIGFCCIVMAFLGALGASIASSFAANSKGESSFLIGLLVPAWCYFGLEQELRLLKLVDRLPVDHMSRTDPPAADAS